MLSLLHRLLPLAIWFCLFTGGLAFARSAYLALRDWGAPPEILWRGLEPLLVVAAGSCVLGGALWVYQRGRTAFLEGYRGKAPPPP